MIKGTAPLLLSRNTLKSLDAKLDFAAETVELQAGPPRPLQMNTAGQFILNVLDTEGVDEEALVVEGGQTPMTEEDMPEEDVNQFMQGPTRVLTRREQRCLLAHSETWNKEKKTKRAVAELFSPPRFSAWARVPKLKCRPRSATPLQVTLVYRRTNITLNHF